MSLPIDTAILSLKVGPSGFDKNSFELVDSLEVLINREAKKVSYIVTPEGFE